MTDPNASTEDLEVADRALEEIKVLRRVLQTLRPFSARQRRRILAYVQDELEEQLEQGSLSFPDDEDPQS